MNRRQVFPLVLCTSLCVVCVAALLLAAGEPARAQAASRHVAATGVDRGDCASASHPCRTIQYALGEADAGDLIKVAAGVYADTDYLGGYPQVLHLYKSATIRGGYGPDFGEPPDPFTNLTVLDAQGKGRVIFISDSSQLSVTIDGLQITGGDATGLGGEPWGDDMGGGVYAGSASVLIRNCQVYSNTAEQAAGVAAIGTDLFVYNSRIFSNTAQYGGGLLLYGGSGTLSGNAVLSNTSRINSGGIYILHSQVELTDNLISANSSWYGGGVHLQHSSASLSRNTIHANRADYCGLGGGIYAQTSELSLLQNEFTDNVACGGGGLSLSGNQVRLDGNLILGNSASIAGGGMRLGGGGITLLNDVVAGNYSESGSGLHLHGARVRLVHTTIAGNGVGTHPDGVNGDGVGIELEPAYNTTSRVVATNTILVSHTVGISVAAGSSAHLEATLWGDGMWANTADWAGEGAIITGTVNIWGEPAFADHGAGDYHIMAESSAVDAGVDAGVLWDVDGDARPDNCAYDIGADELYTGKLCPRIYLPLVVRPFE